MTNSRDKGARGERELAAELRKHGYDTHRGMQYKGGPDSPDVSGLPYIHIECKRRERFGSAELYDSIAQASRDAEGTDDIPAVFHRTNNNPWIVSMKLEHWMKIYRIFELYADEEGWWEGP